MTVMDKLNRDGNMLGRLCALALIVAAVVGIGRVSCYGDGQVCPFVAGFHCPFVR
jgi:hypothetical protein